MPSSPRPVSLGHLVARIEHRIRAHTERALAVEGLGLEQWRTVELLADGAAHSMSEIAGHVMVPAPTLTKIVDRLADAGLVSRHADVRDRRRILVLLTDDGQLLHRRLAPEVLRAERELAGELGPAASDLVRLLRLLAN